MRLIYTIGYSGFKEGDLACFIKTLKDRKIDVLIDVRSDPHSSYFQEYNKERLEPELKKNNIAYRNYHKEFGAKQSGEDSCSTAGTIVSEDDLRSVLKHLTKQYPIKKSRRVDNEELNENDKIIDYNKFAKSNLFKQGVNKLDRIYSKGHAVVLMCSEKKPNDCHRAIMIAKELSRHYGYDIQHLIAEKDKSEDSSASFNPETEDKNKYTITTKSQLEIEEELKNKFQLDAYQPGLFNAAKSDADIVETCYRGQNILVGWRQEAKGGKA